MLKDAKIHFFGILWFLFWRKKMLLQVLTVTLSHVMLGYRRFQKACHYNPTLQRTTTVLLAFMAERHPPSLTLLGDTLNSVFFLVVVSCQG